MNAITRTLSVVVVFSWSVREPNKGQLTSYLYIMQDGHHVAVCDMKQLDIKEIKPDS